MAPLGKCCLQPSCSGASEEPSVQTMSTPSPGVVYTLSIWASSSQAGDAPWRGSPLWAAAQVPPVHMVGIPWLGHTSAVPWPNHSNFNSSCHRWFLCEESNVVWKLHCSCCAEAAPWLTPPGLWFCHPQHKKHMKLLEQVYKRAIKLIKGMELLTCKDRLRKLGMFSLEKRRLCGELATFQHFKGLQGRLFVKNCSDRTRGMDIHWERGI